MCVYIIYKMYLIISTLYFPFQLLPDLPPPFLTSFPLLLTLHFLFCLPLLAWGSGKQFFMFPYLPSL